MPLNLDNQPGSGKAAARRDGSVWSCCRHHPGLAVDRLDGPLWAFGWRRMLETGAVATVREIAAAEKINASYVSRVLRPSLLAPEIAETILDGRQPVEMTLPVLMQAFPVGWVEQQSRRSELE